MNMHVFPQSRILVRRSFSKAGNFHFTDLLKPLLSIQLIACVQTSPELRGKAYDN